MILTFILTAAYNVYAGLFELLPTGSLPSGVSTGMTKIITYMYGFNELFPVDTLFQVFTAFIVFETAMLLFDMIQWMMRKIPLLNIK